MLSPADINECEGNAAGCEYNCENTVGDYKCECESGHVLATDLHSCLGKLHIQEKNFNEHLSPRPLTFQCRL